MGQYGRIEIIDLASSSTSCQDLTNLPVQNYEGIGGLAPNRNPIFCDVCDGLTDYRLIPGHCYLYENGAWKFSPPRNSVRRFASISQSPYPNGTNNLFVTGGNNVGGDLKTAEVLTDSGWQKLPSSLPVRIAKHCMVLLNSTTVLIIGGRQNKEDFSPNTFYFNTEYEKWIEGPKLMFGRMYHSCGMLQKDSQSLQSSVIVAGGRGNIEILSTVEILDVGASDWRAGPNLPLPILSTSMVEGPSGGVLLIGGYKNGHGLLKSIYKLSHANSEWVLMPQKLRAAAWRSTAFLVPDEITNCS